MCPRAVVLSVVAILLLAAPPVAVHSAPQNVVAVSEEGDVFHLLHSVTVDGGEDSNDEARGISVAPDGMVYAAGYVTVAGQGRNIWIGKYNENLVYQDSVTVNGVANGDDEGYTMAFDGSGNVYLIGYMTLAGEGHDIWLGKFDSDLVLLDSTTVTGPDANHDDGYGVLFGLPLSVDTALDVYFSVDLPVAIVFVAPALIMIGIGSIKLARFLHDYPVRSSEVGCGGP